MAAQVRTQQISRTIQFVPGAVVSMELPRMSDLETIFLDLNGTFTYPAAAAGALKTLGPQALIQRVELICDGKITVLSAPGWAFGIASDRSYDGQGGGSVFTMTAPAANAAATVQSTLYVDLMQVDGYRPKDSNLRVRGFSIVELRITFGNWTDCFTNAASVPTVYALNVNMDLNTCTELDPDNAKPAFVVKRTTQVIAADSSNSNFTMNLPVGNGLRSVKFYTHVSGIASDAVLNNVTAFNGIDIRVQSSARALRNRLQGYKLRPVGFNEVDFARQARGGVLASNVWAVPTPAQPQLTLDFNGIAGAKIEMVICEYVGA